MNAITNGFEKRLDEIGWALFLIMTGAVFAVPESWLPHGAWLIGTGVLILGINVVRYNHGLPVSGFATLGVVALAAGIATLFGVNAPVLAICLIVIGFAMLAKPMLRRHA